METREAPPSEARPHERTSKLQEDLDALGPAFLAPHSSRYWLLLLMSLVVAVIMGIVSSATTNLIAYGLESWRGNIYHDHETTASIEFFAGKIWFIAIVFGGGLTNGLIQAVPFFNYPRRLHCLYAEVRSADGVRGAPAILLANSLGLALGGSAGPEAAAAAAGGAAASFIYDNRFVRKHNLVVEEDRRLFILVGMAVGIGSILPTPVVAVSLIYELFALSFPKNLAPATDSSYVYLKYVVCAGIGSIFSYAITAGIGTVSSANHLGDEWSMKLETVDGIFSNWAPLKGALLGVIGGTLGTLFVALTAVCNKAASKFSSCLDRLRTPVPKLGKVRVDVEARP